MYTNFIMMAVGAVAFYAILIFVCIRIDKKKLEYTISCISAEKLNELRSFYPKPSDRSPVAIRYRWTFIEIMIITALNIFLISSMMIHDNTLNRNAFIGFIVLFIIVYAVLRIKRLAPGAPLYIIKAYRCYVTRGKNSRTYIYYYDFLTMDFKSGSIEDIVRENDDIFYMAAAEVRGKLKPICQVKYIDMDM